MAVSLLGWFRCSHSGTPISASSTRLEQTLWLAPPVLQHVAKYKQLLPTSTEAGGQIFGSVTRTEVRMMLATGPYRGDEQGRFHYRSNLEAAQRAIERQAKAGLLYLGEWHTHAEDYPSASDSDMDAMKRLVARSQLNINPLFMLIVGRKDAPRGLHLCSVSKLEVDEWRMH